MIGKRSSDGYWEFTGGKVEDESLEDCALRELAEETGLEGEVVKTADGYPSPVDSKFNLRPVLIETDSVEAKDSREHDALEWIKLEEFYRYETMGQYRALEKLELVNGDVALAVACKEGKCLVLKRSEKVSSAGFWNFPGGKIEDESAEDAVIRELREETGLEGEILETGDPYIGSGELGYWRIYPFLVEVAGSVELNYEHSDYRWVEPGEIKELETLGAMKATDKLGF